MGEAGKQVAEYFEMINPIAVKLEYWIYLPANYSDDKESPLIVFLHGIGERGTDITKVKNTGLPKIVEDKIEAKIDFPFVTVSPQCHLDVERWNPDVVFALIQHIQAKYKIDKNRIYATGLSMGGIGTWQVASKYPDIFAAIAPVAGAGEPSWAENLKNMPIWVFHNIADKAITIERAIVLPNEIERIRNQQGVNVELKKCYYNTYDNNDHDAWTRTYNRQELFDWFLLHSRA